MASLPCASRLVGKRMSRQLILVMVTSSILIRFAALSLDMVALHQCVYDWMKSGAILLDNPILPRAEARR